MILTLLERRELVDYEYAIGIPIGVNEICVLYS